MLWELERVFPTVSNSHSLTCKGKILENPGFLALVINIWQSYVIVMPGLNFPRARLALCVLLCCGAAGSGWYSSQQLCTLSSPLTGPRCRKPSALAPLRPDWDLWAYITSHKSSSRHLLRALSPSRNNTPHLSATPCFEFLLLG